MQVNTLRRIFVQTNIIGEILRDWLEGKREGKEVR